MSAALLKIAEVAVVRVVKNVAAGSHRVVIGHARHTDVTGTALIK